MHLTLSLIFWTSCSLIAAMLAATFISCSFFFAMRRACFVRRYCSVIAMSAMSLFTVLHLPSTFSTIFFTSSSVIFSFSLFTCSFSICSILLMIASFLSLLGIAASSWPFSFSAGSGDMTFGVLPLLFLPLPFLPCLGTAPSCFSRSARRGAFAFASISSSSASTPAMKSLVALFLSSCSLLVLSIFAFCNSSSLIFISSSFSLAAAILFCSAVLFSSSNTCFSNISLSCSPLAIVSAFFCMFLWRICILSVCSFNPVFTCPNLAALAVLSSSWSNSSLTTSSLFCCSTCLMATCSESADTASFLAAYCSTLSFMAVIFSVSAAWFVICCRFSSSEPLVASNFAFIASYLAIISLIFC